jgi:hypothetical protein
VEHKLIDVTIGWREGAGGSQQLYVLSGGPTGTREEKGG